MTATKYRWPCGTPMSEPMPWKGAEPYLHTVLPNGQVIMDWQMALYDAWRSQIDEVAKRRCADLWIDRVARGEGCA